MAFKWQKIKQSPLALFVIGLVFFAVSGLAFYLFITGERKRLGQWQNHYQVRMRSAADSALPSYFVRQYSQEIARIGQSMAHEPRYRFIEALHRLDFVKKIILEKQWFGPHKLNLRVFLPLYYITLPDEKRVQLPILAEQGRILKHHNYDLPVLQLSRESVQIKNGFLIDQRVVSWARFTADKVKEKNLVIFSILSELIIEESWTLARIRDLRTKFILPVMAKQDLAQRWDATYRYIKGKGMAPRKIDLRGQSAIIQP